MIRQLGRYRVVLLLYNGIWYLLGFIIPLLLLYRLRRGKEHPQRLNERQARATVLRPKGKLVWMHAASLGEGRSAILVMHALAKHFPDWNILFTTVTVTAAEKYLPLLPEGAIHQFAPLDHPLIVRRFMRTWAPDGVVLFEQELWPNILQAIRTISGPKVLLQARFSHKSLRLWSVVRPLFIYLCSCFTLVLCQTEATARRIIDLGITKAKYRGNLKRMRFDEADFQQMPEKNNRPWPLKFSKASWVAMSIHREDIPGLMACQQQLLRHDSNTTAIWVLRHPAILPELIKQADDLGIEVIKWEEVAVKVTTASAEAQRLVRGRVIAWDRIGGIANVLRQAIGLCVMGGSFHPHIGGHNPFEPIAYNKMLILGPHMENFSEDVPEILAAKDACTVDSYQTLPEQILRLGQQSRAKRSPAQQKIPDRPQIQTTGLATQVFAEVFAQFATP